MKPVNGTDIFNLKVSNGKTGLPFQKFHLFRKLSSGTNQKHVFHLHPNRNFRNFLVNGKRPNLKHVLKTMHKRARNRVVQLITDAKSNYLKEKKKKESCGNC